MLSLVTFTGESDDTKVTKVVLHREKKKKKKKTCTGWDMTNDIYY